MEEKILTIVKLLRGKKAPPFTIEMDITNKCNLRCRMCWLRNFSYSRDEIDDETWIKTVEEACRMGIKEFRIPGSGEPFMRRELILSIMEILKENGKKGLIISNGTLIDKEIARKMVKIEWDILTLSIDGPSARIHDYIRGVKGSFERVISSIRIINSFKKKYRKKYPYLRMNTVLTNKNIYRLGSMVSLAYKLGFSEILFQPITVFSEEGRKLLPTRASLENGLKEAGKIAQKLGIRTNATELLKKRSIEAKDLPKFWSKISRETREFLKIPCYEPFYNIIITPYGDVGPCAVFGGKSKSNIAHENLRKIWYKDFEKFRRDLKKGKMFDFCKNCCVPIFLENERIRKCLRDEVYGG